MSNRYVLHFPGQLNSFVDLVQSGNETPWKIKVHSYPAMISSTVRGSLGLGEAYMADVWDCDELDTLFTKLPNNLPTGLALTAWLRSKLWTGTRRAAYDVGARHYSIGNDLYKTMLDRRLTYTCGVWDDANTLDKAQENKLALTAKKLELYEGMRVLDIGSGWGSMIGYLAENHGVRATGLTVSHEQAKYANQRYDINCATLVEDYRQHRPKHRYDRIVSIGMFEHVGERAYRTFFEKAYSLLAPGGIFLLHTITSADRRTVPDPWVTTYIFPNSQIPAVHQVIEGSEELFRLEHAENLGGRNYDKTLMAWWHNFKSAYDTGQLDHSKYNRRFYRMWELYLKGAAGNFRAEKMGVHQFKFRRL